jgi:hypothetical protein
MLQLMTDGFELFLMKEAIGPLLFTFQVFICLKQVHYIALKNLFMCRNLLGKNYSSRSSKSCPATSDFGFYCAKPQAQKEIPRSKTNEAFPLLARHHLFFPAGFQPWLIFTTFLLLRQVPIRPKDVFHTLPSYGFQVQLYSPQVRTGHSYSVLSTFSMAA